MEVQTLQQPKIPTDQYIVTSTIEFGASLFGIAPKLVCGSNRSYEVMKVRYCVSDVLRNVMDMKLIDIAHALGRTDHTTVMNLLYQSGIHAEQSKLYVIRLNQLHAYTTTTMMGEG
jgi:chromosomal replication initiation ATPase DnaA